MKKFFMFVFAMIVSFAPGLVGMLFTPMGNPNVWFDGQMQSVLTPQPWVFGLVWTILYALLGIALFLIISNDRTRYSKTKAYWLFLIQMILNAFWCYVFFGLNIVGTAMLVVILLLLVAIWMARAFWPISRIASYLVVPYILWLCVATYLNGMILYLN